RQDAGGGAVEDCDRAALGHGGAVVVGDRRVVDRRERKRDCGRVGGLEFRRVLFGSRAVVAGLVGEGVGGGLAAVVAVAEGAVGVEGHAAVRRIAELRGGEGVEIGGGACGEGAEGCVVEDCDRAALGRGGAVVVGNRRVGRRRVVNRDGGRGAALGVGGWWRARPAVVAGLVGEGVGGGLAAVVAVAEGAVGVEGHAPVGRIAELRRGEGV